MLNILGFTLTPHNKLPPTSCLHYISEKPNVTFSCASSITLNEGDNFTCVCKGEGGSPPANVTWCKDNVQISETGKENQTLTVVGVNETDSGTYKCEARSHTNDSFADEKSIKLIVRQLSKYMQIYTQ